VDGNLRRGQVFQVYLFCAPLVQLGCLVKFPETKIQNHLVKREIKKSACEIPFLSSGLT